MTAADDGDPGKKGVKDVANEDEFVQLQVRQARSMKKVPTEMVPMTKFLLTKMMPMETILTKTRPKMIQSKIM